MISQKPETQFSSLFLRQSYLDSYDEYKKSLARDDYPVWDYVILTASNEAQAVAYREQIASRTGDGKLPQKTHYAVLPDPDGKRVGSGGATLNVLRYINNLSGGFEGLRILVIHSGGDSKRVPQYSACGKLFSPVPRELPDGRRSTLFDEFIIGMTAVPSRISDGMLVCSGDVLLLFNPLQLDFYTKGAAALSIKENIATGKNHGVYVGDADGNVGRFLHKQTEQALTDAGAVDARGNVDIDTGAVIFGSGMLEDLYSLVDTDEKFAARVNERVRLSFYADFLYPLASASTEEGYQKETPEGEFSPSLAECRRELWAVLHKYRMRLLRFSPASFIHFGTTGELRRLMTDDMPSYAFLNWSGSVLTNSRDGKFAASDAYISPNAHIGDGSYIEDSYIHKNSVVGRGCVISGVTLSGETVPDNTVLHGLKLSDGRFVARMYGVADNPKEPRLMGSDLPEPLWTYKCYPVCGTIEEAVRRTLNGERSGELTSLRDSFNAADVTAILPWQAKIADRVRVETLIEAINTGVPASDTAEKFRGGISHRVIRALEERAARLDISVLSEFNLKIRIYYYLSRLTEGKERERLTALCFDTICSAVLGAETGETLYNDKAVIARDEVVTRLPVRVNFGGGWSDTPPYCLENGGTVLNAAITLDGRCPIEVVVRRIPQRLVILASADNGSYREFDNISDLRDCRNTGDPFALHKAALIACGIIPQSGETTLGDITDRLGGGIYLSTQVINIPRGSGLGTSSILAGACVRGIYDFLGIEIGENELYGRVMCMEQIMSTGGGWQDQVGGLAHGIKMVTSGAGMVQQIRCTPLCLSDETVRELGERFVIIYTGQRRLARNLLREVVGKYIGADPVAVNVLREIQRLAVLMRFELENGNVDGFAELLNRHWELSCRLDGGCTNTCIDHILRSVDDLVDGHMICGAGGGGFLQVVMKKGVTADQLRERLYEVFAGSGVDVWKCELFM